MADGVQFFGGPKSAPPEGVIVPPRFAGDPLTPEYWNAVPGGLKHPTGQGSYDPPAKDYRPFPMGLDPIIGKPYASRQPAPAQPTAPPLPGAQPMPPPVRGQPVVPGAPIPGYTGPTPIPYVPAPGATDTPTPPIPGGGIIPMRRPVAN
jgi:hypothetical protein